jgi:hypothetical protein
MSHSRSVVTIFVCLCKLKLMHLRLHGEDMFTLLLRHGQLHCLMHVATVEIAKELYSMPHELLLWHEGGLLGSDKSANQPVANIGEPGNCLKVIYDALIEVCLPTVTIGGALVGNNACPFGKTYVLKTLTHQVEQC